MIGPTLEEFATYVEDYPGTVPSFWGDGASLGLYPLLGWLNTHPVVLEREALILDDSAMLAIRMTRPHHNQVGTVVGWAARFLTGPGQEIRIDVDSLPDLFVLAGRAWQLRSLIAEARQGVRGYDVDGTRIRMEFTGDPRLDALDRLLEVIDDVERVTGEIRPWTDRAREWLAAEGRASPWRGAPPWLRQEFQTYSEWLVAGYPSYLPAALDVGGFTMGEATAVLQELLARALYAHVCLMFGSSSVSVTIPAFRVDRLSHALSRATGVRYRPLERILDLLTVDLARCPDPCLTPLVPIAPGWLVPMSSLIVPSSPLRNMTRLLQGDPARFGDAGRELGALGARTVASTLARLEGALVTTSVQIIRPGGAKAGDLDVVAFDPVSGATAIIEVLWRISADGSSEVAGVEEAAHKKRQQVARVRGEVTSGSAVPSWPPHWRGVDVSSARWFIVSADVLPVRPVEPDGIVVRSNQLLDRALAHGASVADLITLMDAPPYPPDELVETSWHQIEYGEFVVDFDLSNAVPGSARA